VQMAGKSIGIFYVGEENDDVQIIPMNQGEPNTPCIGPGSDNILDSVPGGDDSIVGGCIITGSNGICESARVGNDEWLNGISRVGMGKPYALCVGNGSNGERDTYVGPGDGENNGSTADDEIDSQGVNTGDDGICNTKATTSTPIFLERSSRMTPATRVAFQATSTMSFLTSVLPGTTPGARQITWRIQKTRRIL